MGKQLRVSQKRSRSPDGAPEEPVAELINVHGQDDNHRVFCWEWRRGYKNPNAKPEDYWAEARYPLKSVPNLRGNLYLDHLVPMSISAKALGWAHNAQTQLEVKYFIPANRSMKRSKKEGLKITQGSGDSGETHYAVDEVWEEADSIKDLMDGLHNMAATVFQIRPWDWLYWSSCASATSVVSLVDAAPRGRSNRESSRSLLMRHCSEGGLAWGRVPHPLLTLSATPWPKIQ